MKQEEAGQEVVKNGQGGRKRLWSGVLEAGGEGPGEVTLGQMWRAPFDVRSEGAGHMAVMGRELVRGTCRGLKRGSEGGVPGSVGDFFKHVCCCQRATKGSVLGWERPEHLCRHVGASPGCEQIFGKM